MDTHEYENSCQLKIHRNLNSHEGIQRALVCLMEASVLLFQEIKWTLTTCLAYQILNLSSKSLEFLDVLG